MIHHITRLFSGDSLQHGPFSCTSEAADSRKTISSDMSTSGITPEERVLSLIAPFNMIPKTFAIPALPSYIKKAKLESNGWFNTVF